MSWQTELIATLPAGSCVTDPDVLETVRRDHAGLTEAGTPAVLVRPSSRVEVQTVLELAARHGVPVVARGAGSGLAGGANAIDGCIVLATSRMNRIVSIQPDSMLAVVEPGVLNGELARAVAEHGLWYPPDPASYEFSSLGGNVATNAGGLCCVKYGTTRDFVLGLEVVLADGSVVRTGGRTRKSVAGYDLTSLFVGSEGTLGVVTEITLRLRPARTRHGVTLLAFFPTLESAGSAVCSITRNKTPALLELMDRRTLAAVEAYRPMELDTSAAAMLLARFDDGEGSEGELDEVAAFCEAAGATYVARTADPTEGDLLMNARRLAYPALEHLGQTLLDDVAVPIARIPELLAAVTHAAETHEVIIGTFGHAGDGNMHPTIVFDPHDAAMTRRARAAFDAIVKATLALGGTVTGEHGVGLLKVDYLESEVGAAGMRLHRAVKNALDPRGILNPGKVLRRDFSS